MRGTWNIALRHHIARMLRTDLDEVLVEEPIPGWWRVELDDVVVSVRLDGCEQWLAPVRADAAHGFRISYRLLRELNDHNLHLYGLRTWWDEGDVSVGAECVVESLEPG